MDPRFPREDVKWRQAVEQFILQFDVDIKRLWKRLPQGFRQTDGEFLPYEFPLQVQPPPDVSGATPSTLESAALTGTHDTAGSPPSGSAGCGPCGSATWSWSTSTRSWVLVGNDCGAGCNPVAPTGVGGYAGEVETTCCVESTSGTPGSGTQPTGCDCGLSTYEWNGRTWILVDDNCVDPCKPGEPPGPDGEFIGEQRLVCCTQTSGTPDTGSSLSGTPGSGSPSPATVGTPRSGGTPDTGESGGQSGTNTGAQDVRSGSYGDSGTPGSGTGATENTKGTIDSGGTPNTGESAGLSGTESTGGGSESGTADTLGTVETAGTGAVDACGQCPDGAPQTYQTTVSGVSESFCSGFENSCLDWNGTFNLEHQSGCTWQETFTSVGPQCQRNELTLSYNSTESRWELEFLMTEGVAALYTAANLNCLGKTTFSLDSTNANCTSWPSSLDVEPA